VCAVPCLITPVDLCRPSLRLSRTQGEFDWEFENIDSLPELQDLVLKEILEFQADPRNTQPIQYSSRLCPAVDSRSAAVRRSLVRRDLSALCVSDPVRRLCFGASFVGTSFFARLLF
jgi:hypothetical protein